MFDYEGVDGKECTGAKLLRCGGVVAAGIDSCKRSFVP